MHALTSISRVAWSGHPQTLMCWVKLTSDEFIILCHIIFYNAHESLQDFYIALVDLAAIKGILYKAKLLK